MKFKLQRWKTSKRQGGNLTFLISLSPAFSHYDFKPEVFLSSCSNHPSPRRENTLAKLINENLFAKIFIYAPGTSGCLGGNLQLWALHCVNLEAIFLNVKYLLHEKNIWSVEQVPSDYSEFGEGLLGWREMIFERWKANPLFEIALCTWKGAWIKVEDQLSSLFCLMHKTVVFQTFITFILICLFSSCSTSTTSASPSYPHNSSSSLHSDHRMKNLFM